MNRRGFLFGVGLGILAHHKPGHNHGTPTTTTTTTAAPTTTTTLPPGPGDGLFHDAYGVV